jgi:putative salt-induced outer membrane protein
MIKTIIAASLALVTFVATPTLAQDETGWVGEVSLTANKTTGNTDTTDFGAALKLNNIGQVWRHKINASADFGEVDNISNRERYILGYKVEREINDRLFGFAEGDYFSDKFGAFTDGYFVGGGLGYTVIEPGSTAWDLSTGIGYRSQTSILDTTTEEFAVSVGSDFDWQINENVSAYNDAGLLWSDSDTYLWTEVGLTANLMGNFAARASFRVDHHTDVPFGTEKTDTVSRFGIVYTID